MKNNFELIAAERNLVTIPATVSGRMQSKDLGLRQVKCNYQKWDLPRAINGLSLPLWKISWDLYWSQRSGHWFYINPKHIKYSVLNHETTSWIAMSWSLGLYVLSDLDFHVCLDFSLHLLYSNKFYKFYFKQKYIYINYLINQ